MNPWLWTVVIVVVWLAVVTILLFANHERAEAGRRFDQTWAGHYRDNKEPEDET